MNMMEMVLALFAIVLFTTLSLTYNQAIWAQTDYLNNATLVVQASQICHSILDEADAKLFSKQLELVDLLTEYNYTDTRTYSHLPITFNVDVVAINCDELGEPLEEDDSLSLYKKITISVSGHSYLQRPYTMHRIYTETFIR
ncbi:MAG: hypothetical protein M0Q99_12225 [Candidatus Cloacimonetes bacterium]|nr:hypothetical protein [Candidatus Cloacimonadota bacterium]MCK9336064.1 hypothetical protein [Candidatus Cloacimonadota bacterium]